MPNATPKLEWATNGPVSGAELAELFQHAPWAKSRTPAQFDRMLRGSGLWVTARHDGTLPGFARAITDGIFRALLDDVLVVPAARRVGVGTALVARLLVELREVEEISLTAASEMEPFYARAGFARYAGLTMKRQTRPRRTLSSP